MDLGFTGILDIILVLGAILFLVIGYFKGFMNKALSILGVILILVFSYLYCRQIASLLKSSNIIYPSIYSMLHKKMDAASVDTSMSFVKVLEVAYGIPTFLANIISFFMGSPASGLGADAYCDLLALEILDIIVFIVVDMILLIALGILHFLTRNMRKNAIVRVVDGIFGMILYLCIYSAFVILIFFVFNVIYMNIDHTSGFGLWLTIDMQLETDKFRISKVLFENNYLNFIFGLFKN